MRLRASRSEERPTTREQWAPDRPRRFTVAQPAVARNFYRAALRARASAALSMVAVWPPIAAAGPGRTGGQGDHHRGRPQPGSVGSTRASKTGIQRSTSRFSPIACSTDMRCTVERWASRQARSSTRPTRTDRVDVHHPGDHPAGHEHLTLVEVAVGGLSARADAGQAGGDLGDQPAQLRPRRPEGRRPPCRRNCRPRRSRVAAAAARPRPAAGRPVTRPDSRPSRASTRRTTPGPAAGRPPGAAPDRSRE